MREVINYSMEYLFFPTDIIYVYNNNNVNLRIT